MFKITLTAATLAMLLAASAFADDEDRRGRGDDDGDRYDRRHDDRDDDRDHRRHDRRDDRRHDRRDDRRDDRRHDRRDDRRDDWRDDRRDGRYWHDDVRRYYRGRHDDRSWNRYRNWRHVPPSHYSVSFGYRSGYELAWADWRSHGRYNRNWRRHSFRGDYGFRAGYEAGWRDAAIYFSDGYGPRYWARDPRGSWYFGFHIDG